MDVPPSSPTRLMPTGRRLLLEARLLPALLSLIVVAAACGSTADEVPSAGADSGTEAESDQPADNDQADDSDDGDNPDLADEETADEENEDQIEDVAQPIVLPFGLTRCDPDLPYFTADPALYRDTPIYLGNNQPIEELQAWAETKPGFQEAWIDRSNRGWVTLGFTEGVAARQAELEAEFPGYGVVAVEVPYGNDELQELWDEIFAVIQDNLDSFAGGLSVPTGQVNVYVPVLDEETLAPLAAFADRPICVDGADPADAVSDGPQPTEGDGWRLLAAEQTGFSYRTGVASNPEQYDALWETSGVTTERPEVNFETEIVIWFGAVYGSGCEIRMDDVVVDVDGAVIHGDFVVPGNPTVCPADANPHAFLVAIERSALPEGRFIVQLDADDPPLGAPEERTVVNADLSRPASEAPDGAITEDPALTNAPAAGYVIGVGGAVEPGVTATYELDVFCDFNIIGPFNALMWAAIEPVYDGEVRAEVNPSWAAAAVDGVVSVDVVLEEGPPPVLSLSANGHTIDFEPARSTAVTDCR